MRASTIGERGLRIDVVELGRLNQRTHPLGAALWIRLRVRK